MGKVLSLKDLCFLQITSNNFPVRFMCNEELKSEISKIVEEYLSSSLDSSTENFRSAEIVAFHEAENETNILNVERCRKQKVNPYHHNKFVDLTKLSDESHRCDLITKIIEELKTKFPYRHEELHERDELKALTFQLNEFFSKRIPEFAGNVRRIGVYHDNTDQFCGYGTGLIDYAGVETAYHVVCDKNEHTGEETRYTAKLVDQHDKELKFVTDDIHPTKLEVKLRRTAFQDSLFDFAIVNKFNDDKGLFYGCKASIDNLELGYKDIEEDKSNFPCLLVIVGHPHGMEKSHVSFGWTDFWRIKKLFTRCYSCMLLTMRRENVSTFLEHSVPTCPGSSGSPVILFYYKGKDFQGKVLQPLSLRVGVHCSGSFDEWSAWKWESCFLKLLKFFGYHGNAVKQPTSAGFATNYNFTRLAFHCNQSYFSQFHENN